ncbi:MAG: hypothetical protein SFX74_10985 [Fimbriimonadaceae bacterium]|nr:hypothetical protein [Fimbriimonadaceae bacterium]
MPNLAATGLIAFWTSLSVAAIACKPVLQLLRSLKAKQVISQHVPEGHQVKVGTPNMGGLIVIAGFLVAIPLTASGADGWFAWLSFAMFAALGFADDYLVPRWKPGSRGIDWLPKLGLQVLCVVPTLVPLIGQPGPALGLLFLTLFFANAFNFADGLDALAGGMLLGLSATLAGFSVWTGDPLCFALALALLGGIVPFLFVNAPPARVFMGDTGSMPIGAMLGLIVFRLATQPPWLASSDLGASGPESSANLALWYAALIAASGMMIGELVPVPMQILAVKLLKRRIFPFTPIHHAFEKAGWKETRVVWSFVLTQLLFSALAVSLAVLATGAVSLGGVTK